MPYTNAVEALLSSEYPMALMACEEQDVELASSTEGRGNCGALCRFAHAHATGGDAEPSIFSATSVSQAAPWLPQDFDVQRLRATGRGDRPFIVVCLDEGGGAGIKRIPHRR